MIYTQSNNPTSIRPDAMRTVHMQKTKVRTFCNSRITSKWIEADQPNHVLLCRQCKLNYADMRDKGLLQEL